MGITPLELGHARSMYCYRIHYGSIDPRADNYFGVTGSIARRGRLVAASGGYLQQGKELLLAADVPDGLKLWLHQLPDSGDSTPAEASGISGDASDARNGTGVAVPSESNENHDSTHGVMVSTANDLEQVDASSALVTQPHQDASSTAAGEAPEWQNVLGLAGRTIGAVSEFLSGLVLGLFDAGLFIFLTGFFFAVFSSSWPAIRDQVPQWIPHQWRDELKPLMGQMDVAVSGFIRGRLTITTLLMVWFAVGWWLCGVPHALILGVVIGALTLIPYVSVIGLPLAWGLLVIYLLRLPTDETSWYLLEFVAGESRLVWWKILLMPGIIYLGAQLLDDYVLSPIIQGKATDLSMAAIIVAVLVGGELGGLYGMLLAIPAAACVKIGVRGIVWPRLQAWLDGKRSDALP